MYVKRARKDTIERSNALERKMQRKRKRKANAVTSLNLTLQNVNSCHETNQRMKPPSRPLYLFYLNDDLKTIIMVNSSVYKVMSQQKHPLMNEYALIIVFALIPLSPLSPPPGGLDEKEGQSASASPTRPDGLRSIASTLHSFFLFFIWFYFIFSKKREGLLAVCLNFFFHGGA